MPSPRDIKSSIGCAYGFLHNNQQLVGFSLFTINDSWTIFTVPSSQQEKEILTTHDVTIIDVKRGEIWSHAIPNLVFVVLVTLHIKLSLQLHEWYHPILFPNQNGVWWAPIFKKRKRTPWEKRLIRVMQLDSTWWEPSKSLVVIS